MTLFDFYETIYRLTDESYGSKTSTIIKFLSKRFNRGKSTNSKVSVIELSMICVYSQYFDHHSSNSKAVYIFQNNSLHSIPSMTVFIQMGRDIDEIKRVSPFMFEQIVSTYQIGDDAHA